MLKHDRFISRKELYKKVWKYQDDDSTRVVQQILQKLKTKIGYDYFKTARNKGVKII
jgi:DNA-binding response OmpR family regulator